MERKENDLYTGWIGERRMDGEGGEGERYIRKYLVCVEI